MSRNGREEACGARAVADGRCARHRDRRPLREQVLDPLGPYVAAVEKVLKSRRGLADK